MGGVSPRIDGLAPGKSREVSLSKGIYDVTVMGKDGRVVESTMIKVRGDDFRFDFGCVPDPGGNSPDPVSVPVWLSNTSGDCGTPMKVFLLLNRVRHGPIKDGATVRASSHDSDVLIEVVFRGNRIFAEHIARVKPYDMLFFGCTDPVAVSARNGVRVLFDNGTDVCVEPKKDLYLTLSVDGNRLVGLSPGTRKTIVLAKGKHDLKVYVGFTRRLLLSGTKDVKVPFRIHYGCAR